MAAAAGCGPAPSSGAVGAMRRYVSELGGGFAAQWKSLVAPQRQLISEADYVLCAEEAYAGALPGRTPFQVSYEQTVATRATTVSSPAPPGPPQRATAVTARVRLGRSTATITRDWFMVGGTWRWAVPGSPSEVERALCPALPPTGSPFPPSSQPGSPATTLPAPVPPAEVKVQVLNGLLAGSLAAQWSARLSGGPGYQTLPPDDATARVTASAVYILTPGYEPEADALAVAAGLPVTAVVAQTPPPASAPIPTITGTTADLVLVVGPDLAG